MTRERKPEMVTLEDILAMMGGVPRSTARNRLRKAKIRHSIGRHPESRRVAVLYRREDVEKLIAEGIRPQGRPPKAK
jgi:hypothetical protein